MDRRRKCPRQFLTPTATQMPTSTPVPVAEILNIQAACACVEEALAALRVELSPHAEPRVVTEAPPCPTTNRAAASTVLRVGVSVLASAANVSRALARGATLGDCSSELRLTDVVVSNEAPHTDFKSNAVWAIPCALVGLAMLVAAAMMGLRWLGIGTANRRRKFRDLAEHGSREGSKVDTLSNTSLTSNRGDHPLQRSCCNGPPTATGSRRCPPDPPHRRMGRSRRRRGPLCRCLRRSAAVAPCRTHPWRCYHALRRKCFQRHGSRHAWPHASIRQR
jgi:hypothetical protein